MKVNQDPRGLFVELMKQSMGDFDRCTQISYLTIEPNYFRGGHYHKSNMETFILLEGDCDLVIERILDGESEVVHMELFKTNTIGRNEKHTLLSKKGAKLLVLSEKEFDPQNPDTFV